MGLGGSGGKAQCHKVHPCMSHTARTSPTPHPRPSHTKAHTLKSASQSVASSTMDWLSGALASRLACLMYAKATSTASVEMTHSVQAQRCKQRLCG
eukprot:350631-Chlamydomonas_euryale.AAC.5